LSQAQQRPAIHRRPLGTSNSGADNFIKHPRRNTASRLVGEPDIYNIPLAASGTKDLELLSEKGMVWIENF
jgi:hypothetical protein